MTMTDIYESRLDNTGNKGPIYPFDERTLEKSDDVTGSWYVESELYVTQGSRLLIQGGFLFLVCVAVCVCFVFL